MMSNHHLEEKSSVGLAIGTIDVHPKFLFRFDYDDESLKSLSESIRQVGQLQPGRVVPKNDASGYLVYIGIRRFMAIKKLYSETSEQAFSKFYAIIDEGLTEAEMFARAIAENMGEKGERKELSLPEEILTFGRFSEMMEGDEGAKVLRMINRDSSFLRKRLALARNLSEERLGQLYRIEKASGFRFTIAHLEYLQRIEENRRFLLTAAVIAEARLKPNRTSLAEDILKQGFPKIGWFQENFPELNEQEGSAHGNQQQEEFNMPSQDIIQQVRKKLQGEVSEDKEPERVGNEAEKREQEESNIGAEAEATTLQESRSSTLSTPSTRYEPPTPFFEVDVLFLNCPLCGYENPCRLSTKEELTFYTLSDDGKIMKDTLLPEFFCLARHACGGCGNEFFVIISKGENGFGTNMSDSPPDLKGMKLHAAELGTLTWDPKKGKWVKITDGGSIELNQLHNKNVATGV
jgi:ParB-like chromosome segregation protein Spo0J